MERKILIIIVCLFCGSCGVKGDPEYKSLNEYNKTIKLV